ncbi:MAG: LppM family (lipo)protein, partial [Jiangellaceae bacterium]
TDLPEGSTSEPYDDGEFVGAKYTFTDAPLSTFDEGDTEGLHIVHEGDEFILTGALDLSDTATGDLEGLEGMFEGAIEDFDFRISVTFPGEVIEHNGDLDGTTVTWVPQPGDNVELSARAQDSGGAGGLPIWGWILIAAAIVAVLAGALFYFSRNRTKPDDAAPGAGAYPPPPGAPGSYPPPPTTDIAPNTAETPLSSAGAGAEEAAEALSAGHYVADTPIGAEESELDAHPAPPPGPETPADDREPPPPPN